MNGTVPVLSIVCMVVAVLAGVAIPAALFLALRKKRGADIAPFLAGCAVFIVFALLIEGRINAFIYATDLGQTIRSNIWFYGIFGGLMAGLFEETGRYVAFKTILKKNRGNDRNALMYGAGHGGFEAFYILIFSMVPYIVMSVKLNAGMADALTAGVTDAAALQRLYATFAGLANTAPPAFLMSVVERLAAVVIQISCSVLVWFSAKDGGRRFRFFFLAILLHALVDAAAVILSRYLPNVWIILAVVYLLAICYALLALAVWRKCASCQGVTTEIRVGREA